MFPNSRAISAVGRAATPSTISSSTSSTAMSSGGAGRVDDNPRHIFFSVVMPAHNEEELIEHTCESIIREFESNRIDDYEILIVNDNSNEGTGKQHGSLAKMFPAVRGVTNTPPNGQRSDEQTSE